MHKEQTIAIAENDIKGIEKLFTFRCAQLLDDFRLIMNWNWK